MSVQSRLRKLEAIRFAPPGPEIYCPPIMTVEEWEAELRGVHLPSYLAKRNHLGETHEEHCQRLGLVGLLRPLSVLP